MRVYPEHHKYEDAVSRDHRPHEVKHSEYGETL